MANDKFEEQFLMLKLKKYIIDNTILDAGDFFIYINSKCDDNIKQFVKNRTLSFKQFIDKYNKNPLKTVKNFEKEKEAFITTNNVGVEKGIRLRELQ